MNIALQIEDADVARLTAAYDRWQSDKFVQERIRKNASPASTPATTDQVWQYLALALTTSQQRSGPGTKVEKLWSTSPCPFSLAQFDQWKPQIGQQVAAFLKDWGGIRCYNRIGDFAEHNHRLLFEQGGMDTLGPVVQHLVTLMQQPGHWDDTALAAEREACKKIMQLGLLGIGNKQCRNWLMNASLLRYELPIDSRVLKFLRPMMATLPLDQDLLMHESYYLFVEDAIHALCRRAGILPCVADAVMFLAADTPD